MRVAIVGGGVIGLASAYYLVRGGAQVELFERGSFGGEASRGNAGWITPGLSAPLAAPGVPGQALRAMRNRKSPIFVRPRLDPSFAAWCWRFWQSCRRARYEAGLQAVVQLNQGTLELYDELAADGVEFEMHRTGLVFAGLHERTIREELRVFEAMHRAGYRGEVITLSGREARELDPALSKNVVGALHAVAERHVRPETLTAGLVTYLLQSGARLWEHTQVNALARGNGGWEVRLASERARFDRVVLAAGVWTAPLVRGIGSKLRLEAAKGYSVTAAGAGIRPAHALYLLERKVGCSPFNNRVRLAGTFELAGIDQSLNRRRLDAIIDAAGRYLHDWRPQAVELEWAGLRPMMADSLPVIGPLPGAPGAYVATGHGMLGVTLAAATGALLSQLILERRPPRELEPFRVDR
jgi:D-amino-acid dehydrogenase